MDTLSAATTSLREMDPEEIAASVDPAASRSCNAAVIRIERNARSGSSEMGD
jgi:hypothetical protein